MNDLVRPLRQPSRRTRSGKLKSVTFTGCWTCRSRKIKCDERQRNGCRVCEKAGLDCAGYGVNLCWVTGDKRQDPQGMRRRRIKPDQSSSPSLSDDEIARILSTLDTMSSLSNTVLLGPFAVFHSQTADQADGCDYQPCGDLPPFDCPEEARDSVGGEAIRNIDANISNSGFQSLQGNCTVGTGIEQSYPPQLVRDSEVFGEDDSMAVQSQMGPDGIEALEVGLSPSWNSLLNLSDEGIVSSLMLQSPASPNLGLSLPLFQDHQTSTLMHHYMDHVADLLQPVLHPSNPWRTTYFPFALEGCPELFLSQNSTPSSYASIALFHSLLSSAAFHLRNLTGDSKFHKLGLQHRTKSLQALNAALVPPSDSQLYTVHLTAMLSLVTIDTMTGEDSDFPIHLTACRQLRKPPLSALNDSGRQVSTICHFLTLLSRTTSLKLEPPSLPSDHISFLDRIPHFHSDERSIEHIYGITPTLGNLLEKTCQIAEYLTLYQSNHTPYFLISASEELKYELCAWDIDSEPFYSITPEHGTMLEIARCQARAFHSAVLIFYYRAVENFNPIDLEDEVMFIWQNLTDAENLKGNFMGGERRAAPMSWPAFIAACEATDRQPWAEWWARVQSYGMGNFTKQWRVIQELWNFMDTDNEVTSWIDALKQSGELILPI